ncbi:hypothetical protein JX266_003646 [Neoarthrinium moseri]|nr:hypothetical protein JX266_003646 [Neoarthrinium moseri]
MVNVNGTEVILAPPAGYVVNFENPPQIGRTEIFAVVIVENILAFAFLCQRLYTKIVLMKEFQIEDATVILAWATSIGTQAELIQLYVVKAVGVHAWEMPLERYQYFSRVIFAAPLVYTFTVASAKATLCFFYRRLSPFRTYQIFVWITMFICVGSSMGIFFSLVFACKPLAASWEPTLAVTAQCLDRPAIYVATAGIGIITDVILLALPIPVVIGLNIPTRQKIIVVLLFAIGSITVVTSIVRLIILLPSLANPDQTYALTQGTLWICIESNLLIMCCCLPTLRRFFRHIAPTFIGEKVSTGDSTQPQNRYPLRTFGSGPKYNKGQKSRFDTLMRTQATRLDDDDHGMDDVGNLRPDVEYHDNVTNIRGGLETQSSEEDAKAGYESDDAIINSRTSHRCLMSASSDVPAPKDVAVASETTDSEDAPVDQEGPPPNGGHVAWLNVAGCFALYLNTLGLLNTFGVFQTYYEKELLRDSSASAISWIGSIQAFFLMSVGVFVGPLFDAGHCRALLVAGTCLLAVGFMTTSVAAAYWQVFLAQGVCIGLGTSCLAIPSIALVPMYFTPPRRTWAMSAATLGSGLGSTAYPIMFQALQTRIGFAWTVRVLGFISFAFCVFAIVVMKPRYKKTVGASQKMRSIGSIVREARLGEKEYIIFVIAVFFNNVAFFEPLYYLQSYALDHGMRGQTVAGYLLAILNGSSIFGRLVPSAMAGKLGVVNTFIIIYFLSGASVFYWINANDAARNISFAVLYGFFSGGVVAFQPVVLTTITDDLAYLGTRLGALSILKGIGSLAGPPIAGAILQSAGGYLGVQLFTGFAIMLSVAFALGLRLMMGSPWTAK